MTHQADRYRPVDDPDVPSEAVGTFPWPDLARLGIPALGWIFVVGAVLVGARRIALTLDRPLVEAPAGLAYAVAATIAVLLPAALLRSAPDAARTYPLVLAGLALGAIGPVVDVALAFWSPGVGDPRTLGPLDFVRPLLGPAASLLVGAGLLRLRARPITRLRLLGAFVVAALAISAGWVAIAPSIVIDLSSVLLLILVPVASAFVLWVPVAAWLGGEHPRPFWGLLAAGLPLTLVSVVAFGLSAIAVLTTRSDALFLPSSTADAIATAVIVLLALVAYGRHLPVDRPLETA